MDKEQQMEATAAAASAASAAAASLANKFTFSGAWLTVGSWFVSSEFGILMGIVIGLGGLLVNWYYRHKENKRAQQLHDRKMETLGGFDGTE